MILMECGMKSQITLNRGYEKKFLYFSDIKNHISRSCMILEVHFFVVVFQRQFLRSETEAQEACRKRTVKSQD